MYIAGGQPQLRTFYSDVEFPVGRGTQMISPLVKWDHSLSWFTPTLKPRESFMGYVTVNLSNPEYSYIIGNELSGIILMPGMGYVVSRNRIVAS